MRLGIEKSSHREDKEKKRDKQNMPKRETGEWPPLFPKIVQIKMCRTHT